MKLKTDDFFVWGWLAGMTLASAIWYFSGLRPKIEVSRRQAAEIDSLKALPRTVFHDASCIKLQEIDSIMGRINVSGKETNFKTWTSVPVTIYRRESPFPDTLKYQPMKRNDGDAIE